MYSNASTQKQNLEQELERILPILVSQYTPSKIILFGSMVGDSIHETSDIDLLLIKNTSKRYWERIDEVLHLIHPKEAMDIFVLTSKEIEESLQKDNHYLKEILNNGKALYETTN